MTYQIQTKNDLSKGAVLAINVPEKDVDKKALYTLLHNPPTFLLPFTYRLIDDICEFTYQVGTRSKMTYLSGKRSPVDYSEMWSGLLKPLVDCGDWFMKPFSFVLQYECLYCDKNGKSIGFVYIPTLQDCSSYEELKILATEVARQNPVTDAAIENKIMWALQEFKPQAILDIVNVYKPAAQDHVSTPQFEVPQSIAPVQPPPSSLQVPLQVNTPSVSIGTPTPAFTPSQLPQQLQLPPSSAPIPSSGIGEIAINIPSGKKEKPTVKPSKPQKPVKEKVIKEKKGFFDRFKKQPQEIMLGADIVPVQNENSVPMQPIYPQYGDDANTVLDDIDINSPRLRYIGATGHPMFIEVNVAVGGIFTIGRFDPSVGVQQSNFEFDMKTKAVGRRHAAIERRMDGFYLVDLNSQAGTYVGGQKLMPNAAVRLERGCRVSFGYSGADYMWEE